MNRKPFIFCLIFFCNMTIVCNAQRENIWMFGDHIGFDFNGPVCLVSATPANGIKVGEPAATISDDQGQLLFYTNGEQIANRLHQVMPNGTSLIVSQSLPPVPSPWQTYVSNFWGTGATLIVPAPGSTSNYYVFSLTSRVIFPNSGRLYYSTVNMELDGGFGDVEPNMKCIQLDQGLNTGLYDYPAYGNQLTAVAGSQCNIWLLASSYSQQSGIVILKAYNITRNGIDTVPVISTISSQIRNGDGGCSITVSPDRTKLAYAANATLFDFDACTGTIKNGIPLQYDGINPGIWKRYASVAFSPDNSKLYASTFSGLNDYLGIDQYDISSGDSTTMVNSRIQRVDSFAEIMGGTLKLGPDDKIYVSNQSILSPYLKGVIEQPNLSGMACQFVPNMPVFASGSRSSGLAFPNVVPIMIKQDTTISIYSDSMGLCNGSAILLQATDTTGSGYIWQDGPQGFYREISKPGTYRLTYTATCPCTFHIDSFIVHGITFPNQYLGRDTLFCSGTPVNLHLSAAITDGASYYWSNGNTSPDIIITDTGNYWLRVSFPPCENSDSVFVGFQKCECYFNVANAFSPNGDGLNDIFRPAIETDCPFISNYMLNVYNRYGQRVYSGSKWDKGWDGTQNGKLQDLGTYFYEIRFKGGSLGKPYYRKGEVQLLR